MKMDKATSLRLLTKIYPEFKKGTVFEVRKGSNNGIPILIKTKRKRKWAKLLMHSQMEDDLIGIEEKALKKLKNPYVVKLLDIRSDLQEQCDILLFEYIDGKDLDELIRDQRKLQQPFSEAQVRTVLMDVVRGITAIWKKGWVHQDIKPKNIRFARHRRKYILLDFGIAHYAKDFNYSYGRHPQNYVSPEQLRSSLNEKVPVTFNSDIFQLGIIAYEMITLKHPFKEAKKNRLNTRALMVGKYSSPKKLNPRISDRLSKIVAKMLNPHLGFRYRTPENLVSDLSGKKHSVSSSFESGVYFQPWPGPQGYLNILDYSFQIKPKGIVIPGSQIPGSNFIRKAKEKYKIIFDPETFLLCSQVKPSWHGTLKKQRWNVYPISENNFKNLSFVKSFLKGVIKTQIDMGADYLIPPYFNIDNFDSEWIHINGLMYHECLKYCRRLSINTPLIAGISVSESIIKANNSRKKLVDFYSQFSNHEAYFVRLDGIESNTSVQLIKCMIKLIEELQFHKPVLLADADTISFGYLAKGLSSLSTSLASSKRTFNLKEKYIDKKSGGVPTDKFFVPELLQFVNVEGDLSALIRLLGPRLLCNCGICKKSNFDAQTNQGLKDESIDSFISKWSKADRNNHFLCCLAEWKEKMRPLSSVNRSKEFGKLLGKAKAVSRKHAGNPVLTQIINGKIYSLWETAFLR